jgi:hypothetical protein
VADAAGKIMLKAKVASEPGDLVRFFRELGVRVTRSGLEAEPLSQWLHAGLAEAGFAVVLRLALLAFRETYYTGRMVETSHRSRSRIAFNPVSQ